LPVRFVHPLYHSRRVVHGSGAAGVDPNCTVRDSRAPQRHRRSEFVAFSEIVTRAPQRGQTNVSVLQPRSWESCGGSLIGRSGSGAGDGVRGFRSGPAPVPDRHQTLDESELAARVPDHAQPDVARGGLDPDDGGLEGGGVALGIGDARGDLGLGPGSDIRTSPQSRPRVLRRRS
jgi:hypothetical protein